MKYLSLFFLIIICSCSPFMSKKKNVSLSTFDEQRFLIKKEDSIKINFENMETKKFIDSCNKYKLNCIIDGQSSEATYPGGVNIFRQKFYENLRIPKNIKPSKIRIKFIINKQNVLEKIKVEGCDNDKLNKEIFKVFSLPIINRWRSAKINGRNYDYEIMFYLFIKTKQPD